MENPDNSFFDSQHEDDAEEAKDELRERVSHKFDKFDHSKHAHYMLIDLCAQLQKESSSIDSRQVLNIFRPEMSDCDAFQIFCEDVGVELLKLDGKTSVAKKVSEVTERWLLHYPYVDRGVMETLLDDLLQTDEQKDYIDGKLASKKQLKDEEKRKRKDDVLCGKGDQNLGGKDEKETEGDYEEETEGK